MNRPTSKTYQNDPSGTPVVNYFYDNQTLPSGAPSFDRGPSIGALVAITYGGGSASAYRGYDVMGRVVRQYQRTDSVNYLVEAAYSASMMTSETYPSVPGAGDRRTVTYTPDSAGRLASLNSNATTYAPAAAISSIGYASHNGLKTETYGNSLVHAVTYNNRLQPNEIKLGTSSNPTSILSLAYNYGTTNNNGNVLGVTYNGGGLSYTQSFGYDQLNRLTTSVENGGASWSQTNGYDRYGNRWVDLGGGNQSLYFNTANNRISGWSYDAVGNLLNDGAHSYTYDAEGKISKVDSVTAYTYDGEGRRVKKLVGENTRFVYGIGGQLIAEFDGSTGSLKKEYVYGGATLITIEPAAVNSNGTQYTTSDNLGSPRVITKSGGLIASRHDYMPFGTELGAGTGGRTTGMGFSNAGDTNRKKFTGYERDTETGLDFAQARYYSNTQGRFTSPDPLMASAKATNPQSWNRYAYVDNNPMVFSDPSGMARGPAQFHGNQAEISHAREVGWADVADQETYYEDRLAGAYDSIVETVEPIDGALHEQHHANAGTGTGPQNPDKEGIKNLVNEVLAIDPCAQFAERILAAVSSTKNPALKGGDLFSIFALFLNNGGQYTRTLPPGSAGWGNPIGLISKGAQIAMHYFPDPALQTWSDALVTIGELFHLAGSKAHYTDYELANAAHNIPEYAAQLTLRPESNVFNPKYTGGNAKDKNNGGYSSYFHDIERKLCTVPKP